MPNKGYKITEKHRKKLSEAHKGYVMSEEQKKKISLANKGGNSGSFKVGSKINLGRKRPDMIGNKFNIDKIPWNKGKPCSEETKIKIRKKLKGKSAYWNKGEKCHFWKGGITPINQKIRDSIEYRLWREAVFARDNWTCQECEVKGGKLHPHHIKSFAKYPELRFAIDNGLTLCVDCHKKTDTYGVNSK